MLAIRLQRTGRRGHAQFRVVVQDARRSPTSGKVVARLGSYNPHTKTTAVDSEKAAFYLKNGAQPSGRVAALFKKEGIKLPAWVRPPLKQKAVIRNPEKLRRNRPAGSPEPDGQPVARPPAEKADQPAGETLTRLESEAPDQPAEQASNPAINVPKKALQNNESAAQEVEQKA